MTPNSPDKSSPLRMLSDSSCGPASGSYLGCTIPEDPELVAQGWQRRFIGDARMAKESAETYQDLGFEVRLEPIDADNLKDECGGCKIAFQAFKAVYTRKV